MRPTLFMIGPIPVRGYGLMLAIGFLIATYVAGRRAEKRGIPSQMIFDLCLCILIGAVLGARIFHVLQHPNTYSSFWDLFKVWEGGLAYYGGFILSVAAALAYIRWRKLSTGKVFDIVAPSLMLGTGIGRIGCLFAGCCFGKPTSLPWGITFPEYSAAWYAYGMKLVKVHPTQIYSSLSLLSLFVILILLQRYARYPGQLFFITALMYSVHRFLIDFLRFYEPEERIGSLATSQVVSIIAIVIVLAAMIAIAVWRARHTESLQTPQSGKVKEGK